MTTLIIKENSPEAKKFLEFARTLPFVEESKKTFDQASAECNAISLEAFSQELKERVTKRYHDAKG